MSLIIDQLNVRFDEHHVIHDLHFELASEEIVAILGPSGCGKDHTVAHNCRLTDTRYWNHSIEWSPYRTTVVRIARHWYALSTTSPVSFQGCTRQYLVCLQTKKRLEHG